ncbi:hypothetical protein H2248_002100 [Termitomyces sp. 'cryptogamus']|nr:hypothetical protein H2248_002100 [Termitomyces sp. 'cryptogamus']
MVTRVLYTTTYPDNAIIAPTLLHLHYSCFNIDSNACVSFLSVKTTCIGTHIDYIFPSFHCMPRPHTLLLPQPWSGWTTRKVSKRLVCVG